MLQVTGITNQPSQQLTISMIDGTKLIMGLQYWTANNGWYFTTLNWNNSAWVENGRRVVSHPNMLRNYRNQINFGIACFTAGNLEPWNIQSFSSTTSNLYILTPAEVLQVETYLEAQKIAQV